MSAKSQSLTQYEDCKQILDLALDRPGMKYRLETVGRAVNFKHRCNRYKKLLREMEAEKVALYPGAGVESAYDLIIIRQVTENGTPSAKNGKILVFDHHELTGELFDADGTPIILPNPTSLLEPDDDL